MKSDILRQEHKALISAAKAMTPQERLVAFVNHSALISRFYEAGKKFRLLKSSAAVQKSSKPS